MGILLAITLYTIYIDFWYTVAVSKLLKKTCSELFIYAVTFKRNKKGLTIVILTLAVVNYKPERKVVFF